jgi:uncharacterized protein
MKRISFFVMVLLLIISCKTKNDRKNISVAKKTATESNGLPAGFTKSDGTIIDYPQAKGFVNDFAHIFTEEERWLLDSLITEHEKATTNEIAVITFDTIPISKEEFYPYTLGLANKWGIGKKEKNNGIAICLCIKMHKIRIQNGRGIEKLLSDETTKKIIDSIISPEFKNASFFEGTKKGLLALIKQIE